MGANPISVCYDYTNNAVWSANYYNNSVTKLNATTGAVINANITVPTRPRDISFDPSTNAVWTVNYGAAAASAVTKINASTGAIISNYTAYTVGPTSICYDPDGYMWAVYWAQSRLSRFVCSGGTRTDYNILGSTAYGFTDVNYAQTNGTSLGYNSIWAVGLRGNIVYRTRSPAANATYNFPVDISPSGAIWDGSTNTMWVTSYGEDTLTQLIANNTTSGTDIALNATATGVNPYGIAFDNVNNKIWVANFGENTVQRFSASPVLEGTYKKSATEDKLEWPGRIPAAVDIGWYAVEFAPVTLKTPNGEDFTAWANRLISIGRSPTLLKTMT